MEIEDNIVFLSKIELCKRFNKSHSLLYDEITNRALSIPFR